jgi:hypothetical protein
VEVFPLSEQMNLNKDSLNLAVVELIDFRRQYLEETPKNWQA